MAQGDLTVFEEAKAWFGNGVFDFDTNTFKCAILDNTTTPTASQTTPTLSDFTEVGSAGSYTAGGVTLAITWNETAGTVRLDSSVNPGWTQDGSNDSDAYWGLIYQDGSFGGVNDGALCFIDLGGPIDMSAGPLDITFSASGILTLT